MSSIRYVVPGSAVNWNWTLMPVVDAVKAGGKRTTGLGCHVSPMPEIVVMVVAVFEPELITPLMVMLPVPETWRTKNRRDGVEAFTHSHGLRAVPPPGSCTEWVPPAWSSE